MRLSLTSKSVILSATVHLSVIAAIYLFLPNAKQITQKTTVFLSAENEKQFTAAKIQNSPDTHSKQNDKNTKKHSTEQKNENIPLNPDATNQNTEPETKTAATTPQTHGEPLAQKETKHIEIKTTKPVFNASYLKNPPPRYPAISEKRGEEGVVLIRALIGVDGSCKKATLKHSSGYARLDDSALEAVQSWRFVPAKKGSEPIEEWVEIPVEFRR